MDAPLYTPVNHEGLPFFMGNKLSFLGRDMAVDLGTANTLVYVRGRGIVLNEPSVVAINTNTGKIVAVGIEAKRMIGRTPGNIVAVRPLKDGVIADFEITEAMLRYFIARAHNRRTLVKPRIIICVPFGITEVEKRAVKESAEGAGAREHLEHLARSPLIEEYLARATDDLDGFAIAPVVYFRFEGSIDLREAPADDTSRAASGRRIPASRDPTTGCGSMGCTRWRQR